jgi:hypothetical protein
MLWSNHPDTPTLLARWRRLDALVGRAGQLETLRCTAFARAVGASADVNELDERPATTLLEWNGVPPAQAESLAAALMDWRDADTIPRQLGAEDAWYRSRRRPPPRNGRLRAPGELHLIRGFEQLAGLDTMVRTETGRVPWPNTPVAVLATLPGISREAALHLEAARRSGALPDPVALLSGLRGDARDTLAAHVAELLTATTAEPEAWDIDITTRGLRTPVQVTTRARLAMGAGRVVVIRGSAWP